MITKIKNGATYTVTYDDGAIKYVPKINGNSLYKEVKEAIAGGTDKYPTAISVEPEFTQGELDQQAKDTRIAWIDTRLSEIEKLSVRTLRSKSNGRGNPQNDTVLENLDDEFIFLTDERGTLTL